MSGLTLEQMIMDNRISRADLWMQAMTYTEMMYGWRYRNKKEDVRRSWFYKNGYWGDYVAKVPVGPVPLTFSLWEQAEARRKGDKAVVRKPSREEIKAANAVSWGILHGRAATGPWVPQKELIIMSGKKLGKTL